VRVRVHVTGRVQGVGFRPFVWREASSRGLSGWVGNDSAGVVLEAEGPAAVVHAFLQALDHPPPLARVTAVETQHLAPDGRPGFSVRSSTTDGAARALLAPDTAMCGACRAELDDPSDRRFGHPFVTCTDCGPRFTLVESMPYDRSRTTMAAFPMCPACAREYADPADRRFHAEPICCPDCGPQLSLLDAAGRRLGDPLASAAALLRDGAVVAVKGVGGYHLAVDATDEPAVARLRQRKHRPHRPFALLLRDLDEVGRLCLPTADHLALLTDPARPVVIVPRRPGAAVARSVAPDGGPLGVLLPYTPLHALLAGACNRPLVLTSANLSGEPLVVDDAEAQERLAGIADAFLAHDRRIVARADDSVVAVAAGRPVPLRRSRGYVPTPVTLPVASPVPLLACGPAAKATVCIVRGGEAFLSAHLGDLGELRSAQAYAEAVEHLQRLTGARPEVLAHDLHPDYPSTRYAWERPATRRIGVQHHHAHIASCLADNGRAGPVIGIAFDGLGLGPDGSAWGGEVLLADLTAATRAAHLAPVAMPGGDAAVREPWRMALAYLDAAYGDELPTGLAVQLRQSQRWNAVRSIARAGLSSPPTSSAGRLFDAVSALLGVRDTISYDGQAAVELELLADPAEHGSYGIPLSRASSQDGPLDTAPLLVEVPLLIRALVDDLLAGTPIPLVASRFHSSLAEVVGDVCGILRDEHGLSTVALSGGVFCNRLLLARTVDRLETGGFDVLTHRQVPANDGGLALGQAAVAAAMLAAGG